MPDLKTLICYVLGIALAGSLALNLGQRVQVSNAKASASRAQTDLANYKTTAAESARLAERAERAEEQRTAATTRKAIDESKAQTAAAVADADRADAAAGRLSRQLAAYRAAVRRASEDPAAPAGSPSADTALDLFANLLSRTDEAAGVIGRFADASHIAGNTCAAYADGLQPAAR